MGFPTVTIVSTNSGGGSNSSNNNNNASQITCAVSTTDVSDQGEDVKEQQSNHYIDFEHEDYEDEIVGVCCDNDDESDSSIISLDSSASLVSQFDLNEFNDSFDNISLPLIPLEGHHGILLTNRKNRTTAALLSHPKSVSFSSNIEVREYERILVTSNEYMKLCDQSSSYSSCVLFELALGWQYIDSCTQNYDILEHNNKNNKPSNHQKVYSEVYGPVLTTQTSHNNNHSSSMSCSKRRRFTRKNRTRKSIHRSPCDCECHNTPHQRCRCLQRTTETERYDILQNYGFDSIDLLRAFVQLEGRD